MVFLGLFQNIRTENIQNCPAICRIENRPMCPDNCLTYAAMLKKAGMPLGNMIDTVNRKDENGISPMDLANKIRQTYENAVLGKNLINDAPNTTSTDPNAILTPNSSINNENPPAPYNPINLNAKSPFLDSNGNPISNPLDGSPLYPNTNNQKNPFNSPGNPPGTPGNPLNSLGNPLNPLSPNGGTLGVPPVSRANPPVQPSPSLLPTPSNNFRPNPQRITFYSYIPKVTTLFVTSPPIMIKEKASTITYSLPNKTVTETYPPQFIELPPTTIVQTMNAPPVTVTPPAVVYTLPATTKTVVQPVELPPETLTSYAPVETVTAPPSTMLLTKTIQLPPSVVTKNLPPVTRVLPATTVIMFKTKTFPPQTMVVEKVKYFPAYSTIIKTIKDTVVPLVGVRTITVPNSNIIFTKNPNGQITALPITSNVPQPNSIQPNSPQTTPGNLAGDSSNQFNNLVNYGNEVLGFLSGLTTSMFGTGDGISKGTPIFDTNKVKSLCETSNDMQNKPICSFLKNTNCNFPQIQECFTSMMNSNYNYQPNYSQCDSNNSKTCSIVGPNSIFATPTDKNCIPIENKPKIEPISSDSQTGFKKKLKSLFKSPKKSNLTTEIGNAYNEGKDKVVYLSELLQSN